MYYASELLPIELWFLIAGYDLRVWILLRKTSKWLYTQFNKNARFIRQKFCHTNTTEYALFDEFTSSVNLFKNVNFYYRENDLPSMIFGCGIYWNSKLYIGDERGFDEWKFNKSHCKLSCIRRIRLKVDKPSVIGYYDFRHGLWYYNRNLKAITYDDYYQYGSWFVGQNYLFSDTIYMTEDTMRKDKNENTALLIDIEGSVHKICLKRRQKNIWTRLWSNGLFEFVD